MPDISILKQHILKLADHCVKCGLCSAQCPTYLLQQDENESPRGRIALAQALASDALQAEDRISVHLNNCLQCRRCEAICPSDVKYGELINHTSELINRKNPQNRSLKNTIIRYVSKLSHRNWQKIARFWLFFSHTGLIKILGITKSGRNLLRLLPDQTVSNKTIQNKNTKKTVFLFTGCLSHIFDTRTLKYCISLLNSCDYYVEIPNNQTCCGAIAAREGLPKIAQQSQLSNQLAFMDSNNAPIIFFTTGCGSKLKEYKDTFQSEVDFASRAVAITHFLNQSDAFAQLKFSALNKKVLIFNPCSELNVLKQNGVTEKLLARIPGINLITLPKTTGCCGASGSHLLTHQQQAAQIRSPILDAIISLSPDIIVGPNYPCNLHIQAGLKEKNLDIPMIHPIELLFNQVNTGNS